MNAPLRTTDVTAGDTVRTTCDSRRHSGAQQATAADTDNRAVDIARSQGYALGTCETTGQHATTGVAADPTNCDTSSDSVCTRGDSVRTTQRTSRDSGAHQATPAGAPRTSPRTGCDNSAPDAPPTLTQRTTTRTTAPHRNGDTTMTTENFLQAADLEGLTGIPAATWRYWAHKGVGPASFKLGRRRVYRQSVIEAWIAEQEARTQTGGVA
ncbi:helix-turn-helix transcriptional regulator [Nocardia sp. NPDC059691]|uniref:helix-turn-helix transcriptional regulator n=2 Tax=Nocardia TaxID=1817 RepID=UPI00367C886D